MTTGKTVALQEYHLNKCVSLARVELGAKKFEFCLASATLSFVTLGGTLSVLSLTFFNCEMEAIVLRSQLVEIKGMKRAWRVLLYDKYTNGS